MVTLPVRVGAVLLGLALSCGAVLGHGDVQPQPVDTAGLESIGTEWKDQNPFLGNARAIEIGSSGYSQNCARCHGLQMISGGMAPDLRYLPAGKEGDEIFVQRMRHGAIINGMTKMPVFDGLLSQEALWAIRSYLESKHEE